MTTDGMHGLPESCEPLLLEFFEAPTEVDGYRIIGSDSVCDFVVELASGQVTARDPAGQLPTRFVNSSIELLAAFVRAYRDYGTDVGAASGESEELQCVDRFRRTLAELDPIAIANEDNWWSCIVQQAEDGQL